MVAARAVSRLATIALAVGLSSFAFNTSALADHHEGMKGKMGKADGPCAAEVKTHCGDVQPGGGAIMKCMRENKDKFSETCQAHMSERKEKMKESAKAIKDACAEDMKTHCGSIKSGGGAMMRCMRAKKSELSPACQQSMEEAKKNRRASTVKARPDFY